MRTLLNVTHTYFTPIAQWVQNDNTYDVLATVRMTIKFFLDVTPSSWGSSFSLKMKALRTFETSNNLPSDTTSHLRTLWPLEHNLSRPSLCQSASAFKQRLKNAISMRAKRIISKCKSGRKPL